MGLPAATAFGFDRAGQPAALYVLQNARGLRAAVATHGATLVSLWAPGRDGAFADVTLGFDDVAGYESADNDWFGCTVGRYANRIRGARFVLDGTAYDLTANEGRTISTARRTTSPRTTGRTISTAGARAPSRTSPGGRQRSRARASAASCSRIGVPAVRRAFPARWTSKSRTR
jgi:hypothetical protein